MSLSDGPALLRGILDNPEDDAPRLIYSDWLEESGEEERARFIRSGIEWTRRDPEKIELMPRGLMHLWLDGRESWFLDGEWFDCVSLFDSPYAGGIHGFVSRGFISEVRLTCEQFCGGPCQECGGDGTNQRHTTDPEYDDCLICMGTGSTEGVARELFERHPITRVVLVDKKPRLAIAMDTDTRETFDWWRHDIRNPPDSSDLPAELFNFFRGEQCYDDGSIVELIEFATEAEANAALSRVAVAHGRKLAGLDPLPAITEPSPA